MNFPFQKKRFNVPREKSSDCKIVIKKKPDGSIIKEIKGEGCTPEKVKALMAIEDGGEINPEY